MKRNSLAIAVLSTLGVVTAYAQVPTQPLLNTVSLQMSAQGWAQTKSANVIVSINATLKDQTLNSLREQMMTKLKSIAPQANWHIANFSRRQDSSGLETVSATAQARIPQGLLTNIRHKVASVSVDGQKYTISDMQFAPGFKEVEAEKATLRAQLYREAKAEANALNKEYGLTQNGYMVHEININSASVSTPRLYGLAMAKMGSASNSQAGTMPVSQKITLQARVVLARKMV